MDSHAAPIPVPSKSETIEIQTIQQIPEDSRHGKAKDLFTIWFGANIMVLTIFTGSLAYTLFGLSFWASLLSLAVGHLVGAIFMALHSAQGPQLGVPQMIQTRGQFGSYGSLFVVGIVVLMYLGFFASNAVLGGQTLSVVTETLSVNTGIVCISAVSLIAAIIGYRIIHLYARVLSYGSGLAIVVIFALILSNGKIPANFFEIGNASIVGILGTISIAALWQLAYAPYVSDYSRYMPKDTGAKSAFWSSYWGCTLGSLIPMILGVVVALSVQGDDIISNILLLTGDSSLAIIAIGIFTLAIACSNAMNLYCGSMSTVTVLQTLAPRFNPGIKARAFTCFALFLITLTIAIWGKDNFLVNYSNFIYILLYVLVPWTAINLVDYYLLEHGKYDVASFFKRDGGIYGRFNIAALAAYAIGIAVQVPFMSTALYTGSIAEALGGADISWIIGLAVVAPVYYIFAKIKKNQSH
ncbi:cytosine permease [Acinetobacter sp. SwsAc7]|jgi:NCS1 family nucleobase:cation symporter-1|nr:cytosine permease [Acinetobacter sp. SwsAc7]